MSNDEFREEFEAWAAEELGLPVRRVASGDYQSFGMSMAWKAWQASSTRVSRLEIDAARYQWLRKNGGGTWSVIVEGESRRVALSAFDQVIDLQILQSEQP